MYKEQLNAITLILPTEGAKDNLLAHLNSWENLDRVPTRMNIKYGFFWQV